MKQQILNLKKKLLIVERNPESIFVNDLKELPYRLGKMFKLTDITEEQFKELAPEMRDTSYPFEITTAKESLFSKLESQGIHFSNPLGKKPDDTPILFSHRNRTLELLEWEEAEEKVWIKERCYIFEIV